MRGTPEGPASRGDRSANPAGLFPVMLPVRRALLFSALPFLAVVLLLPVLLPLLLAFAVAILRRGHGFGVRERHRRGCGEERQDESHQNRAQPVLHFNLLACPLRG